MNDYRISKTHGTKPTMIISYGKLGLQIAEYRLTAGHEDAEIRAMRRAINKHLAAGGTLGNYQW